MLVAVGQGFSRWLDLMRKLQDRGLVDLVYPEFFDSKKELIGRKWTRYLKKLRQLEDKVKVAVYPDYCYDTRLRDKFNVEWVFPLHLKRELDFALKIADWIAFPNRPDLRDYDLNWFSQAKREYGFKTWLLGLKPRYLRALHLFDACDITSFSHPCFSLDRWEEVKNLDVWARFLAQLKRKDVVSLERWLWSVQPDSKPA